jgi:hypothetical protein
MTVSLRFEFLGKAKTLIKKFFEALHFVGALGYCACRR